MIGQKDKERFWNKVKKSDGCWEWQAFKDSNGYGRFMYKTNELWSAHRFSMLISGMDPTGLHVCHRCDNPKCVRPDHLFLGTNFDNVRDRVAKRRNVKLDESKALEIRSLYESGHYTMTRLGELYGVSCQTISSIIKRKFWSHI